MTDRPPKSPAESQVEVVADQAEDGTYEIRVERQAAADRSSGSHAAVSGTGPVSLTADGAARSRTRGAVWLGGASLGAAAIATVVGIAVSRHDEPPPVPEPIPIESFRAFTIEVPQVPTLRANVLSADVGSLLRPDAGVAEAPTGEGSAEGSGQAVDDGPGTGEGLAEPAPEDEPDAGFDDRTLERLRNVRVSASAVAPPPDDPDDDRPSTDEFDPDDEYVGDDEAADEYDDDGYLDEESEEFE